MKRRLRALYLTAGGLLAAAAPLQISQQPASAAVHDANSNGQLTFIANDGQGYTCTLYNDTVHNNDDPNQPYTVVNGNTYGQAPCYSNLDLTVTITYKDKDGIARRASAETFSDHLRIDEPATYSSITTTVTARYFSCDADRSATCGLAVTASPK